MNYHLTDAKPRNQSLFFLLSIKEYDDFLSKALVGFKFESFL